MVSVTRWLDSTELQLKYQPVYTTYPLLAVRSTIVLWSKCARSSKDIILSNVSRMTTQAQFGIATSSCNLEVASVKARAGGMNPIRLVMVDRVGLPSRG